MQNYYIFIILDFNINHIYKCYFLWILCIF